MSSDVDLGRIAYETFMKELGLEAFAKWNSLQLKKRSAWNAVAREVLNTAQEKELRDLVDG